MNHAIFVSGKLKFVMFYLLNVFKEDFEMYNSLFLFHTCAVALDVNDLFSTLAQNFYPYPEILIIVSLITLCHLLRYYELGPDDPPYDAKFYDCCGAEDPGAPGCSVASHVSYDDEC